MKISLTEKQFKAACKDIGLQERAMEICHGVLVEGISQIVFVKRYGLSRAAVSQMVKRVIKSFELQDIPEGYERVTVILPTHKAWIVKKWAEEYKTKVILK